MANLEPPDPNEKAPAVALSNDEGFKTKGLGGHLQEQNYTNLEAVSSQTVKRARQILQSITSPYAWLSNDVQAVIDILDEMDGDSDFEDQCEDEGAQCEDEAHDSDTELSQDDYPVNWWYGYDHCCTMDDIERMAAEWRHKHLGGVHPAPQPCGVVVMFPGVRT